MKQKPKRKAPRRRNNGSPPPVRAPPQRPSSRTIKPKEPHAGSRILWTSGGAAAAAVVGGLLVKAGLPPAPVAVGLGTLGGSILGMTKDPRARSAGGGALSAAGGQFALMMLADLEEAKRPAQTAQAQVAQKAAPAKLSNAADLAPGEVNSMMERARMRMALAADHAPIYEAA